MAPPTMRVDDMVRHRIRPIFVLSAALMVVGCNLLSDEQVPSSEAIREWMGRFLVEADQIQGVYRNLDIDSLVFTYRSNVDEEAAFWGGLEAGLQDSRWNATLRRDALREYRRSYRKGEDDGERPDMAIFNSFEVARVFFDPESHTVIIGYIQADGDSEENRFEDTGESDWADKALWPRFEALVSKR